MRIRKLSDAESVEANCIHHGSKLPSIGSLVLPVPGTGGHIEFEQGHSMCGGAKGISISSSWARYGYSGGVLDRRDVIELRDYLTQWLDGTLEIISETEGG